MFKSEIILYRWLGSTYGDNISSFNKYHYALGMSYMYLIFHVGIGLSGVRLYEGKLIILNKLYQELQVFDSSHEWYVQVIRSEYKERYKLQGV